MTTTLSDYKTLKTWYDYRVHTSVNHLAANIICYWLILIYRVENKVLFAANRMFIGLSNNRIVRSIANTS